MTSIPLFDLMLARERNNALVGGSPHALEWAVQGVRELIAEHDRIRAIDDEAARSRIEGVPPDKELASALRLSYLDWTERTAAMFERLDALRNAGQKVEWIAELNDRYARTIGRLKITPDDIEEAEEQIRRGEVVPMEDIRREFRAGRDREGSERTRQTGSLASGGSDRSNGPDGA